MASGVKRPLEKPAPNAGSISYCTLKRNTKNKGYGFHLLSKGEGAYIGSVAKSSIAEMAGLKEGDEIQEVNGKNIKSFAYQKITGMIGSNPLEVKLSYKRKENESKQDEEVAPKKRKLCKFGAGCRSGDKCDYDHPNKPTAENNISESNTKKDIKSNVSVNNIDNKKQPQKNSPITKEVTKATESNNKTNAINKPDAKNKVSIDLVKKVDDAKADNSNKINGDKALVEPKAVNDSAVKKAIVTNNVKQNDNVSISQKASSPTVNTKTANTPISKTSTNSNDKMNSKVATNDEQNIKRKCLLRKWPKHTDYGFAVSSLDGSTIVNNVSPDSPASSAGLQIGDCILQINGASIVGKDHAYVVNKIKNSPNRVEFLVQYMPKSLEALVKPIAEDACLDEDVEMKENASDDSRKIVVKRVPQAGFGFSIVPISDEKGATVNNIKPQSSAEIAGLKVGDTIFEVNGKQTPELEYRSIVELISGSKNEIHLTVKTPSEAELQNTIAEPAPVLSSQPLRKEVPVEALLKKLPVEALLKKLPVETIKKTSPVESNIRNKSAEPIQKNLSAEPPQRKCILRRDRNFNGFGFGVTTNTSGKGVYVDSVEPYSPAQTAGLLVGDSIIRVDNKRVIDLSHEEIVSLIGKARFRVELDVCNPILSSDDNIGSKKENLNAHDKFSQRNTQSNEKTINSQSNDKQNDTNIQKSTVHEESQKNSSGVPPKLMEMKSFKPSHQPPQTQNSAQRFPKKLMDMEIEASDSIKRPSKEKSVDKTTKDSMKRSSKEKSADETKVNGVSHSRTCYVVKNLNYDGFGFALDFGKKGAFIETVEKGSPAEFASLKPNDIVTHVNRKSIKGLDEDAVYDYVLENANAVEFEILVPEDEPVPRQCVLRRNQAGFGFNIVPYAAGIGAQVIAVEKESVADVAGLKIGDTVLEVNGRKVQHVQYKSIIDGIKMSGWQVKLVVISSKTPTTTEDTSFTDKDSTTVWMPDKEAQRKAPEGIKSMPPNPLHKCVLRRSRANESYGFGLVYDSGKGHIVSDILDNTPAFHADLKVGDCLIEVNQVNVEKLEQVQLQQILSQKPMQVEFTVQRLTNEVTQSRKNEELPNKNNENFYRGSYRSFTAKNYSR